MISNAIILLLCTWIIISSFTLVKSSCAAFEVSNEVIGQGAQAKVVSGYSKNDGVIVAVKIYNRKENYEFEKRILKIIDNHHKNMVDSSQSHLPKVYAFCRVGYRWAIFMEKLAISLTDKLTEKRNFGENLKMIKDILLSVRELHSLNIAHLDIKTDNLMLTEDGTVKLVDFGVSVLTNESNPGEMIGSPMYTAPERLFGDKKDLNDVVKEDSWSTALTIFEILSDKSLFDDEGEEDNYMYDLVDCVQEGSTLIELQNGCPYRAIYYYYKCAEFKAADVRISHRTKCGSLKKCTDDICGNGYLAEKVALIVRNKWEELMQKLKSTSESSSLAPVIETMLKKMLQFHNVRRSRVAEALEELLKGEFSVSKSST